MALSPGHVLHNRYRIARLLGQGGMGAVYQAVDTTFDAAVAIKENLETSPEGQRQFAREAALLHKLRHPNLPRVTDYFSVPGQGQYLVIDCVEGEDLGQILARQGRVAEAQALAWIHQVLDALEYLHGQDPPVIHRDVKPANIKITPRGQVYLVDFGIAKVYDPLRMTSTGARGVTPGYAPPEQYGQARTDARSDLYAVGATLYSLLTGGPPPDAWERVTDQAQLVSPRELDPAVGAAVAGATLRALAMRPTDRFQTATEFRAALAPLPPPPTRRRERPVPVKREPDTRRPAWLLPLLVALALIATVVIVVGLVAALAGGGGGDGGTPLAGASVAATSTAGGSSLPSATPEATPAVGQLGDATAAELPVVLSPSPSATPTLPPPSAPTASETPTPLPTRTPSPTPTSTPTPGSAGADQVLAYNPGPGAERQYKDPGSLLGEPDLVESPCCQGMVQLGRGGSALVAFTDNSVVDGDGADLQVHGESVGDDYLLIDVSEDGHDWRAYPKASESPGGLDLADLGLERAAYVRLTDLQPGTATGAEVDAVVALHNGPGAEDLPKLPDAVARADTVLRRGPDKRMKNQSEAAAGTALDVVARGPIAGWVEVETLDGAEVGARWRTWA